MCIGCGACAAADPSLTLELDPERLLYRPSHASNAAAAAVCPAVQVDFHGLEEQVFPGQQSTPYGVVDTVMLAQSTDYDRNVKASSGGLIKELLLELLARDDVDGAICLDHVEGLRFEPRLVRDPDEIDMLPGSIYHAVPLDKALQLLREHDGRFVLVAIPCQLEGIYSYIYTHEPLLVSKIHTTIGLLCGWLYSHHALRAICRFKGVDFDQIEEISFRGGGPVGSLQIRTPDGLAKVSRRIDFSYQVAFDRSFNSPRCHLCINHSNFLADIVVGDAWLPSTVKTRTGISLLICRNPDTTELVRRMRKDGRLRTTDVTVDDIKESQKRQVVFGDFAYAYAEYRMEQGLHTPQMVGPNRSAAQLTGRRTVEEFHKDLVRKLELQGQRRYRYLWVRKATVEFPKLAKRYLNWFFVRILRVKSLLGVRKEVSREQVSIFR